MCPTCVTGESNCTYEKPTCWKRGTCHGTLIGEVIHSFVVKRA